MQDSASGVVSAVAAEYQHVIGVMNTVGSDETENCKRKLLDAGATRVFKTTAEALEWVKSELVESLYEYR